jgi:hypothetical protein
VGIFTNAATYLGKPVRQTNISQTVCPVTSTETKSKSKLTTTKTPSGSKSESEMLPIESASTIYTTKEITVTSCPPEVTKCPASLINSLTTQILVSTVRSPSLQKNFKLTFSRLSTLSHWNTKVLPLTPHPRQPLQSLILQNLRQWHFIFLHYKSSHSDFLCTSSHQLPSWVNSSCYLNCTSIYAS